MEGCGFLEKDAACCFCEVENELIGVEWVVVELHKHITVVCMHVHTHTRMHTHTHTHTHTQEQHCVAFCCLQTVINLDCISTVTPLLPLSLCLSLSIQGWYGMCQLSEIMLSQRLLVLFCFTCFCLSLKPYSLYKFVCFSLPSSRWSL